MMIMSQSDFSSCMIINKLSLVLMVSICIRIYNENNISGKISYYLLYAPVHITQFRIPNKLFR
jgi:hypothetical protein